MQINNYSAKDIKSYLHKCSLPCWVLFGFLANLPFLYLLNLWVQLNHADSTIFEKIISPINEKEHRRPHTAASANNGWLDFPVEWRGHTIGVMSHKPQEQSLNNKSKRRATRNKTRIIENNIKSFYLKVINFWHHPIYTEGILYFFNLFRRENN